MMEYFNVMLVIAFDVLLVIGMFVLALRLPQRRLAGWRNIADDTELTFSEDDKRLSGAYRGRHLVVEMLQKTDAVLFIVGILLAILGDASGHTGIDYMRIMVDLKHVHGLTPEDSLDRMRAALPIRLKGSVEIRDKKLYYERRGIEKDAQRLDALLGTLCDLAEAVEQAHVS